MSDKPTDDGPGKVKKKQFADIEFEVLMEYQRQVIKKYGGGRVPWFLSALGDLAERNGVTPNDAMKSALEDFDLFVKDIERIIGPVPLEDDQVNDSDTDLLDNI